MFCGIFSVWTKKARKMIQLRPDLANTSAYDQSYHFGIRSFSHESSGLLKGRVDNLIQTAFINKATIFATHFQR